MTPPKTPLTSGDRTPGSDGGSDGGSGWMPDVLTRDLSRGPGLFIWGLIALCVGIEALLWVADAGLIGTRRWRGLAYQYGGFWAGLLDNWRPNYPLQPWAMFLTYSFLHGSLGHLVGNMLTLYMLGAQRQAAIGQGALALIYGISAIGGAVAFAALNSGPHPMVGASGAIFGLAGAILALEGRRRRSMGERLWPVLRLVLFLVALNVVLFVLFAGQLAWEAHLGGFLAGAWAALALIDPRPVEAEAEGLDPSEEP